MQQSKSYENQAVTMRTILLSILSCAILAGCGERLPAVDIWTAAAGGDIQTVRQHLAAGTDVNGKDPSGGSTPLLVAALFGQTEAARLLLEKGANVNSKNNEGATPLLVAAFFCHPETVKLLLEKGADVRAKNNRGETPLDTVAEPWNAEVENAYISIAGILHLKLDLEKIKRTRPEITRLLRQGTH
jgi:ankyrin repeat protein